MKNIINSLLVFTLLLSVGLMAQSQEVVELKQPSSNKIIIKFMFKNGSMSDPEDKHGLTFTTANTLVRTGTGNLTSKQIQELIYPMAAVYSAQVDKEVTTFTFEVHKDFLNQFYPVIKGLILTPSFAQDDFNRVKSNQQNYVDQVIRASSDEDYSKYALEHFMFRGTPYQHMVAGDRSGVANITVEDVRNHYKQFFTQQNLTLGIAGNYSPAFLEQLKADVKKLPATKPTLPATVVAEAPRGIQVEIIAKPDALGSAIFAGFPMPVTRSNDDFAALMVANSFLGEHRKSYGKLYDKIRSVRSMNYGDYSYIEWYEGGGNNMLPVPGVPRKSNYFSLWIRPVQIAEGLKQQYPELMKIDIGHALFAFRLAVREVDMLVKKGMTKDEFEATRTFLRSYNKLYTQTPERQLGFLMDSKFYGRNNYIQEMDALLAKLTVADVNRAIKKYWQVENMYVTIVTNESEAKPLAEAMMNHLPSPMSYSNIVKAGLPKEVLAEDDEIANYELKVKNVTIVDNQDTFK